MKRTPIALCLAALAYAPAQAQTPLEFSHRANCVEPSASVACLTADASPWSRSAPTATSRAVFEAYRAHIDDLGGRPADKGLLSSGFELALSDEARRSGGEDPSRQEGWRLDAVTEIRSFWSGPERGASFRMAQAVTPEQLDKALADHMAQRDFWNKAEAAGDDQPVGVQQKDLEAALAALLKERASWGSSPSKSVAGFSEDQRGWNLRDILGLRALLGGGAETESGTARSEAATPEQVDEALKALLAEREKWAAGQGDVKSAAASETVTGAASGSSGAPIQVVSQDEIRSALEKLLSERASWGTAPWDSPAPKPSDVAEKKGPEATARMDQSIETKEAFFAVLPTADVESLLRARAVWGSGPAARIVEAPLAAGAIVPLPKDEPKAVAGNVPDPIIRAAEITPAATLKPVAAEDIDAALAALFKQREAFAQGVSAGEASVAGDAASVLTTSSLDELLKQRATWGAGVEGAPIAAPLAAGAEFPLPKSPAPSAIQAAGDPIIHAADNAPVAVLTPVAPDVLASALSNLLAERSSWGSEPTIGEGERPYASLSTSSLEDLLSQRAEWGMGSPTAPVTAPLAAGAVVPLPKQDKIAADEKGADPIIHAAEYTPPVKLTDVAQEDLAKALKRVLAERAAAGKSPSKAQKVAKSNESSKAPAVIAQPAKPAKDEAQDDALAALLKERESYGTAPTRLPERKTVEAQSEDAVVPASADAKVSAVEMRDTDTAYANLSTQSLSQLLKQRDQWQQPASGERVPATSAAAERPAPTQTGALAPVETAAAAACGRDLASIVSARPIEFASSSAAISPDSRAVLKQIGEVARSCPGVRLRIEGHTDASGTAAKNQILSEARARSVMQYLLGLGIEKERLTAVGLGESQPIASNDSAADRAKNRRIDFVPVIE